MDKTNPPDGEYLPGLLSDTYHDGAFYEQRLGLCRSYFRVMRTKRAGPSFIRIGRSVRYGEKAVAAWLESLQVKP